MPARAGPKAGRTRSLGCNCITEAAMPVVVFDISPGEVVVIQNEETAIIPEKRVEHMPAPDLGLQVVEPETEE